jgi:hypothetical protein
MQKWKPIKKVAAGFVAAGIAYAAHKLGVDLGNEDINDAALAVVGIAVAYIVKG